jgi:hypothetical protein
MRMPHYTDAGQARKGVEDYEMLLQATEKVDLRGKNH